jgi:HEAT repeat protein
MRTFEDSAVWALIALLQDAADPDVRIEAAMALGDLGARGAAALPALRAAARDGDDEMRAEAAMAIAKIRPEEAAAAEEALRRNEAAQPRSDA